MIAAPDGGERGACEPKCALAHRASTASIAGPIPSGPSELTWTSSSRPPVGPTWNAGVPCTPAACAAAAARSTSGSTAARRARVEQLLAVEAGHAGGDLADEPIGDPAGVLGALAGVEAVDDVPEVVSPAGGDRRPQRLVGVGADERHAVEDDPQLAGLDVLVDEVGQRRRAPTARSRGTAGRRTRPASPAPWASRAPRPAARSRRRATARTRRAAVACEPVRGLARPRRRGRRSGWRRSGRRRVRQPRQHDREARAWVAKSVHRDRPSMPRSRRSRPAGGSCASSCQWDIVPLELPTLSRPTWPRSTCANACETNG